VLLMKDINHLAIIAGIFTCLLPNSSFAQNYIGDSLEIEKILSVSRAFSEAYMDEDIETLSDYYSVDAKIMPPNAPIIKGHAAIYKRWTLPEGIDIVLHQAIPEEIRVNGNFAHDYGIYNGTTKNADQQESHWQGKYLIVWKKVGDDWKIYLDIWNNMPANE
jgi:ketosteroid isomerase-like protein